MKFSGLFLTPRYLSMAEAGVHISERAVRLVALRHGLPGAMRLRKSSEIPLPEGVISGGEIKDKATLVSALKKIRTEFGLKFINATLPEEKAYLYTTLIERVPRKDLHDVVAFTVEENAPVLLAKSIFSFEMLESPKPKVAVAVVTLETIEAYTDAFESAGLSPVSFDLESQAIAKSLIAKGDKRSHLIIHLGERKTILIFAENGVVEFSSTSVINLEVDIAEAVKLVKSELRRFFVYWDTQPQQDGIPRKKVEQIIVAGHYAADNLLVSKIMNDIDMPYMLGNVWANVMSLTRHLPKMPFDISLDFASAIGAALPKEGRPSYKLLTETAKAKAASEYKRRVIKLTVSIIAYHIVLLMLVASVYEFLVTS